MDEKHRIEYEKNKPENRHKRLQNNLPLKYPFAIAIELSNDCNSNCYMCPRQDLTRNVGHMSLELFKKIIDELSQNKVILRKLFFHWLGEPLMNENFDKMISYAKKANVAEMLVMGSNIIALNRENAIRLIKSELDELFVSLDALKPETYKKIKGHDKGLDVIENNLIQLVNLKKEMKSSLPYIRLKILKSEINKDEITDFKKKWEPIVDEVYVEEDLNAWNGTNEDVNDQITNDPIYKEIIRGKVTRWPCNRLWYQVAISQDGYVSPCLADWDGTGFIGNINNQSLFEIWNSEKLVEMRRKQLDNEYNNLVMCKDCNRWIFRHMTDWLIQNRDKALAVYKKDET